ncbi:MAG: hypothetical protein ACSLFI_10770 [Solirubrobacterales bacterium]
MYERMEEARHSSNAMLGTTTVEAVSNAVVKGVTRDRALLIANNRPLRPIVALAAPSPALGAQMLERSGANQIFRNLAAQREN